MRRMWTLFLGVTALLSLPAQARDAEAEAAAMQVLDTFMAAFNARDIEALERTLHFPHYRIAGDTVSVLPEAGTRPDGMQRFMEANPEWDRSAWQKRSVIHSGPSKVHFDTRFVRHRADGSVLSEFDSIYIVTKRDGRWAIQGRSSFAP